MFGDLIPEPAHGDRPHDGPMKNPHRVVSVSLGLRGTTTDRRIIAKTQAPSRPIADNCKHYRGDRPCLENRLCTGCGGYEPYSHRVCVIKLGAMGDVIRTLCILPELKTRFANPQVTWVTMPNSCRMLAGHPLIDRLLPFNAVTWLTLAHETFDTVLSLDKDPQPCALAIALRAREKLGIGLGPFGRPTPLNSEAQEYFQLGLSDELKFHQNTKSYPQLIYEALGWTYRGQRYELPIHPDAQQRVQTKLTALGWSPHSATLGVNVGAGRAFANKMWPAPRIVQLITQVRRTLPAIQVLLLGGAGERTTLDRVVAGLRKRGASDGVIHPGGRFDEPSFVALVDACDVVLSGDTMAMHVAIALGKGVVAFFGPTCAQEIDLFGPGEKLVAAVPCAPCYKPVCDHGDVCVNAVSIPEAAGAITRVIEKVCGHHSHAPAAPALRAG